MFDFDKRLEMTWFAFENRTFSFFDVNVIICINNSIKFRINHYGDGINSIVYIACYVQLFKYQYKKFPWSHFCSLNFEIFYWIFPFESMQKNRTNFIINLRWWLAATIRAFYLPYSTELEKDAKYGYFQPNARLFRPSFDRTSWI